MQRSFLEVNTVPTRILTYGKNIKDVLTSKQQQEVILIIPGNPGATGFYKMFMHTLHEKTGLPVWIVGHAGHEVLKDETVSSISELKGNENLFGLEGQIEHKKHFINKYVPENVKLHLIGHSIGSYIILNLLKDEAISSKVLDVKLLFPTIEHMADTPNGKFLTNLVKPILWLILFLSWIYTVLPTFLQNALMWCYMKVVSMPMMHFRTLVNFIEPGILEKVFFMAYEELEQVNDRDDNVIKKNVGKIRFLYGRRDGWAPIHYCDKLKHDIPQVQAENSDFNHAFVLKESREIGNLVSDWITQK